MDIAKEPQNIISLCTGMRGLERGIERVNPNVRTICYVEIEAFIIENLVSQMEQGVLAEAPIWSNLKTFPAKQFHGLVHGITAGYPCQPFSIAGERKGTDDPRHLFSFIYNIVEAVKPVWCFFENVGGHLSMGYGEVYRSLRNLGYSVEAGIFTAAEVGAPHARERLFILAIRMDVPKESGKRRIEPNEPSGEMGNTTQRQDDGRESGELGEKKQAGKSINPSLGITGEVGYAYFGGSKEFRESFTGKQKFITPKCNGNEISDTYCNGSSAVVNHGSNQFPAGPGQTQHEWEAPRVESRMGFTVNGYFFREDLLRMAGNGVVEQTAEIAFLNLLKKHGIQ